jgi:hypothetical protein
MFKRSDKQTTFVDIKHTFKLAVSDIKSNFSKNQKWFGLISLFLATTALFLNVPGNIASLHKIQAFLLLLSSILVLWIFFAGLSQMFRGRHSELYYAINIFLFVAFSLFAVQLFTYMYQTFNDELLFYTQWLAVPLLAILLNLALIYFLRIINRHKPLTDTWSIENFFLFTLNFYLGGAYLRNNFDFIATMKDVLSLNFSTLYILYVFLIDVWSNFWIDSVASKFKSMGRLGPSSFLIITVLVFALPFILRWFVSIF